MVLSLQISQYAFDSLTKENFAKNIFGGKIFTTIINSVANVFVMMIFIINNFYKTFQNSNYTYQNVTKIITAKVSLCDFENDVNKKCS